MPTDPATWSTEDALAALAANGHEVTCVLDDVTHELRPGNGGASGLYFWVPEWKGHRWPALCADPHNAVRCAMLDRIAEAGYDVELWSGARPSIAKAGSVTLDKDEGIDFPDLLTAYKAVCTPGEVAVEPERGKTLVELGITEESAKVPDGWERVQGGAMATNEEQYEAMVARGWKPMVKPCHELLSDKVVWLRDECPGYVDDEVAAACLLAGQLDAMVQSERPTEMPFGGDNWDEFRTSVFAAYLAAFPAPAPARDPAEELAEAVRAAMGRGELDAIAPIAAALARHDARKAGAK